MRCWARKDERVERALIVRWRDEAMDDRAEIIGYIEERDPLAAQRHHRDGL
jgi:plasmid stabilization system protein ParE